MKHDTLKDCKQLQHANYLKTNACCYGADALPATICIRNNFQAS